MHAQLSEESANWTLPSQRSTPRSTSVDLEVERPIGVSRQGFKNYLRNSGSLNIGDWAIEGRRPASVTLEKNENQLFPGQVQQAKIIGEDAKKNYLKSTTGTPGLLTSDYEPPYSHHKIRIKREGRANFLRDRESRVKSLLENYGKLSSNNSANDNESDPPRRGVYEQHKKDHVGSLIGNYSHFPPSPRQNPHVKGAAAEQNFLHGRGRSDLIAPDKNFRPLTAEPHIKGIQAEQNYSLAQGRAMSSLFHQYGTLPQSPRTIPRIKYGGNDNYEKGRGDAMRKTLTQCPPSNRLRERPLPV